MIGRIKISTTQKFPGSPVVRILSFHCQGPRFTLVRELRSHKLSGMTHTHTKKPYKFVLICG